MSLILELPPELEAALAADAARHGLALPEYAVRLLATGRIAAASPTTGAELVAYWRAEGLIGTRSEILDAPEHARALRQRAVSRERL